MILSIKQYNASEERMKIQWNRVIAPTDAAVLVTRSVVVKFADPLSEWGKCAATQPTNPSLTWCCSGHLRSCGSFAGCIYIDNPGQILFGVCAKGGYALGVDFVPVESLFLCSSVFLSPSFSLSSLSLLGLRGANHTRSYF